MTELLSCPFCSERLRPFTYESGDTSWIHPGEECHLAMSEIPNTPEAIAAWNRRTAAAAGEIEVKPLVWVRYERGRGFAAKSVFGPYEVWSHHSERNDCWLTRMAGAVKPDSTDRTEDEAKAAAHDPDDDWPLPPWTEVRKIIPKNEPGEEFETAEIFSDYMKSMLIYNVRDYLRLERTSKTGEKANTSDEPVSVVTKEMVDAAETALLVEGVPGTRQRVTAVRALNAALAAAPVNTSDESFDDKFLGDGDSVHVLSNDPEVALTGAEYEVESPDPEPTSDEGGGGEGDRVPLDLTAMAEAANTFGRLDLDMGDYMRVQLAIRAYLDHAPRPSPLDSGFAGGVEAGWQDISTAPHNEAFLGLRVEDGKPPVYWVVYGLQLRYGGEEVRPGRGYRWNSRDGLYNVLLTHWQPLPPALVPTPGRTG